MQSNGFCLSSTLPIQQKNYFKKCRELNLLPLKVRLDLFAILLFHQIIHKTVVIKLPVYITLAPKTTLRYSHTDPLTFKSLIEPIIIKKSGKILN